MAPHRPAAAGPSARIRILDVAPVSQPGDRPRALCDTWVQVDATLARDGNERVFGMLRYRRAGRRRWLLAPLHPLDDGRVTAAFVPDEPGLWEVQLDAWVNRWSAWRDEITRKVEGYGQSDYSAEIAAGCALLQPHTGNPAIAETLEIVAGCEPGSVVALVALLGVDALPDRHELVSLPRPLLVAVDPVEAGRGAWVQLPPRASGAVLGRVSALGADTVLLSLAGVTPGAGGAVAAAVEAAATLRPVAAEHDLRLAVRLDARELAGGSGDGAPADAAALAAALLRLAEAGVSTFELAHAAAVPLGLWEEAAAALHAAAPWCVLSAAGPLGPGQARALCAAGFAQRSLRLDTVPSRAEAEVLAALRAPTGVSRLPRLRLAASGGAALLVAATLADCCSLEPPLGGAPGGGALVLAQLLLELRRDYPAFGPGAELRFLDTGDERVLACLRSTPLDEALVVASAANEPVTTTVTIPGAAGAGAPPTTFTALDLLQPGEPRRAWGSGPREVSLAPGGLLALRLER